MNVKKYFTIVGSLLLCVLVIFAGLLTGKHLAHPFQQGNAWDNVDEVVEQGKINFLVMGTDKDGTRTDVMMLFCLDTSNESICVLSIPRDTRVLIGNNYQKINAAYAINREELAVKTVRSLTGLPIHNYFVVNFEGFREIIDKLGGVEYNVPQDMDYEDPYQDLYIHLKKGQQILNGDQAEQLVRFRATYTMGDLDRIHLQQDFLRAMAEQKMNARYLGKAPAIYSSISKYAISNMSANDVLTFASMVKRLGSDSVKSMTIPGVAQTINGISYYVCDEAEMARIADNIINYGTFEAPGDTGSSEGGEETASAQSSGGKASNEDWLD